MDAARITKEIYSIREWAPLTDIIERVPARQQRGLLFPRNLNITCVDAVGDDFLALGCDGGIVFWYNRKTGEMQKLKSEVASSITCVRIVNSVEYMVASGSVTGHVSVFQIQKEVPPDLNIVAPCTRAKPIIRYTIRDLHRCVISCCEWSKNGMKLFSGDRAGVVVLTEFDYQTHVTKSWEILSEAYEIVQLSVYQTYLLVSTLYRSVVCQYDASTEQWHLSQVGKKDRKQLIDCGGIFMKQQQQAALPTAKAPLLLCGRPGYRFWIADVAGEVSKTLLFKEAVLSSPTWQIPILNPKLNCKPNEGTNTSFLNASTGSGSFRNLYLYDDQDGFVVTHDDKSLYILNIESLRVEAVARGFRKILDFCVCGKEIFVLEGERSLLRLAPLPEKPNKTARVIFNPLMPPPVPILGATICGSFESPVEYEPEQHSVNNAEECFELPPIEKLDLNIPIELAVESPMAEQNRRLEIFRQIGEMDFEQSILHESEKISKKHKPTATTNKEKPIGGIVEIGHETKENFYTNAATLMEASYCSFENNGDSTPLDMKTAFSLHLPDTLSPSTLQKTIAEKAKTLAEELELPEVHLTPISAEELRVSQACAAPPAPPLPRTSSMDAIATLTKSYPAELNDLAVQTTPIKQQQHYYLTDDTSSLDGDYSAGQPVDGICAITVNDAEKPPYTELKANAPPLKFVHTQPIATTSEEINSFLPDFRLAGDPLIEQCKNEPQSSDSNNSSEWEFLNN